MEAFSGTDNVLGIQVDNSLPGELFEKSAGIIAIIIAGDTIVCHVRCLNGHYRVSSEPRMISTGSLISPR